MWSTFLLPEGSATATFADLAAPGETALQRNASNCPRLANAPAHAAGPTSSSSSGSSASSASGSRLVQSILTSAAQIGASHGQASVRAHIAADQGKTTQANRCRGKLTSVFLYQPLVCFAKMVVAEKAATGRERRGMLRKERRVQASPGRSSAREIGSTGVRTGETSPRSSGSGASSVRVGQPLGISRGRLWQSWFRPPNPPHTHIANPPCPSWRPVLPPKPPKQGRRRRSPSRRQYRHRPRACGPRTGRRGRSPCR